MEWEYITPKPGGAICLDLVLRSAPADGTTGIKIAFLHIAIRGGQAVSLCLNLEEFMGVSILAE